MSAAPVLQEALQRDLDRLSEQRRIGVMEAALLANRHPESIRRAARAGELHGTQPEGISPETGRPKRGAKWTFRPACVLSWADNEQCEHQMAERPVSLATWRARPSGGRS